MRDVTHFILMTESNLNCSKILTIVRIKPEGFLFDDFRGKFILFINDVIGLIIVIINFNQMYVIRTI